METTDLKKELETYERLKPGLLSDEGKFVAICGDDLIGVYGTYEEALKAGYQKCGLSPFLVRQILAIEPINYFTREMMLA